MVNTSEFYEDMDFRFPEIAISAERFYYSSKGKFTIPTLTPMLSNGSAYTSSNVKASTSNIVNGDDLGITAVTTKNYMELYVPRYIAELVWDKNLYINSGIKFIVSFIGGDINKAQITGLYM